MNNFASCIAMCMGSTRRNTDILLVDRCGYYTTVVYAPNSNSPRCLCRANASAYAALFFTSGSYTCRFMAGPCSLIYSATFAPANASRESAYTSQQQRGKLGAITKNGLRERCKRKGEERRLLCLAHELWQRADCCNSWISCQTMALL